MQPRKFIPSCDPMLDHYISMNNAQIRNEIHAKREYNRCFDVFADEIACMSKRNPIEGEFKDAGKIFFCEVRNFNSEKEKIEYMNRADVYPIVLCHDVFRHNSNNFYKRVFSCADKIIDILKTKHGHINDSLSWGPCSLFEVVLFHGSGRFVHYFDEEFFMQQLINCLIVLHRGRAPHPKIMKVFSIQEVDGQKTLTIKV